MSDETPDAGLKAGAATLAESPSLPAQARKTRGRAHRASPNLPQKGGRRGPQRGLRTLDHALSAKSSGTGKRSRRKAQDDDASKHPDFWNNYKMGAMAKPSSEYVNDPRLLAMANTELMRAELRVKFFNTFPVLDEKAVHNLTNRKADGKETTAKRWQSEGRIIGLPIVDVMVYPAFQFQSNGKPYPLIQEVNKAFSKECTVWYLASWLVSPNEWLDGETPISAIQRNCREVVSAAERAGEVPVG